jgi:hypothetical protein
MILKNIYLLILNRVNPPVMYTDDFIDWLLRANAGMQHRGNIYSFKYAIDHLVSDHPVVEIGSFCGLSTNIIAYLLKKAGRKNQFITADKFVYQGHNDEEVIIGDSHISHKDIRKYIKESFIRNIKTFNPDRLPSTIEENSDEFFTLWEKNAETTDVLNRKIKLGGKISFCYVDGNHAYEFVKRDFLNVDKYLEKGGFVLFDDSYEPVFVDGPKLMKEIMKNSNYELVMKNPNYLFRKRQD